MPKPVPAPVVSYDWRFLSILHDLKRHDVPDATVRLLQTARKRFFKGWDLRRPLLTAGFSVLLLALAYLSLQNIDTLTMLPQNLVIGRTTTVAGLIGVSILFLVYSPGLKAFFLALGRLAIGIIPLTIGCLVANLHLLITNRIYIKRGRIKSNATAKGQEK